MRVTQPLLRNQQQRPTAVASIDGDRTYTWDELVSRIARLASGLKALGLKEKDRVGVLALNSDRYMELLFAVPWAGGIVVPLNHRWSSAEIAFAVADSDTRIICVDETFENTALEVVDNVDHQLQIIGMDDSVKSAKMHVDGLVDKQIECSEKQSSQDDVSGIFYTGGTTGRSKGVMLTHGNHVSNTLQFLSIIDMTEESVYLHAAPMFHIADALYVYMVTHIGGKHIFIPRFEPALCAQAIQDHKISDIILVPTMIQMLLEQPNFKDFDFSSLQRLYYGASPMPEAVAHDLVNKFPWVKCFQLYGQTESAPLLTALDSKYHNTSNQNQGRMKSAGRAMPAVELKIVDENGEEVPRGQIGEIIAKGPNIMKGYWGQDELTSKTVKDGWLHTGDAAHMDEGGFIFISDRLKDMIISGGENIYSTEVENALYEHNDVAQCAVIGIPDDKWGESVHAIVVPREGANPSTEDLISHCRKLIADYKCPRSISYRTKPLPLSGPGKVLKTELRKPFWEGKERQVN
tara:strand:- start:953 stop:2509 length:1557 start_codon:yes stop_codon:yes gene_type:complete